MLFSPGLFTSQVSSAIAQRGRAYRNRVRITKKKLGFVEAYVFGTHRYTSSIAETVDGDYIDSCTCPYGATCKHTIALSYVIYENPKLKTLLENHIQEAGIVKPPRRDDHSSSLAGIHQSAFKEELKPELSAKTLLEIIEALGKPKETDVSIKSKKDQLVYYVLHTKKTSSWGIEREKTYLSLEAGKAERKSFTQEYTLHDPQDIRNMYSRKASYLQPLDRKILSISAQIYVPSPDSNYWNAVPIEEINAHELVKYLGRSPLVFFHDGKNKRKLTIVETPLTLVLELTISENGAKLTPIFTKGEGEQVHYNIQELYDYDPPILLTTDYHLYTIETTLTKSQIEDLLTAPSIPSDEISTSAAMLTLIEASQRLPIVLPAAWTGQAVMTTPIPILTIHAKEPPWTVTLSFSYDGIMLDKDAMTRYIPREDNKHPIGVRDFGFEKNTANQLSQILSLSEPWEIPDEKQEELFTHILPVLPDSWEVYLDKEEHLRISRSELTFDFETTSGIDWLDISGTAHVEGQSIALHQLLDEAFSGEPLIKINDRYHIISPKLMRTLALLGPLKKIKSKHIRLHRTQIGLLPDLLDIVPEEQLHKEWQKTLTAIRHFTGIVDVPLPDGIKASLRPYQKHGVNFLHYLRELGFGGMLADDMGLGKTLQALILLRHVHQQMQKLSLIVAPTSVVPNWQTEAARFAPDLRIHLYQGKDRIIPNPDTADLIVTSYPLLWRDIEKLKAYPFHYVILDEAQFIKNMDSKTAKAARQLVTDHRLSLTGTPLENNLSELYSQFSFLNPGLFESFEEFKTHYITPIERDNDQEVKNRLKKLITPFLLRRTKGQVLKDLPPKIEQTLTLEMDKKQRQLYETVKSYYQTKLLKRVEQEGIEKSQIQILEALLRLRQVCCDPQLLKLSAKHLDLPLPASLRTSESIKREETMELLQEAISGGHNVLLFSQFTQMLDLLFTECKRQNLPVLMLTGKTKNRQTLIEQFQSAKDATIFLISLKAGGTGLNLTAADYVIHYDPWWNPAVETQATDRAHRIGQTRTVNVYKLIVKDSIEEKILSLQEKKKGLIDDIITSSSGNKRLTREDLAFLLS